jgi:hypothetical protein
LTDEAPPATGRLKKAVKFDSQVRADRSHSPYRLNPPAEIGKDTSRSPQTLRRPTIHIRNQSQSNEKSAKIIDPFLPFEQIVPDQPPLLSRESIHKK